MGHTNGHAGESADLRGWQTHLLGGCLQDDDLKALLACARLVQVGARRCLLRAEDDRVLLLLSGSAKASIVTPDGDEVITEIVGPGHAAGLVVVLGHADMGKEITSLKPVDALSISGRDLRHLVETRSGITSACLQTVADQHAIANAERSRFAGTCISQRVAHRILELAMRWGQPEGHAIRITLPLTQEELAAWSGASRESVAKVLQNMRANGLIATGRRSLRVLDASRLRERCAPPAGDSELRSLLATGS